MLVIWQHREDTEFVKQMWQGLDDVTVLECSNKHHLTHSEIRRALQKEKDMIITFVAKRITLEVENVIIKM